MTLRDIEYDECEWFDLEPAVKTKRAKQSSQKKLEIRRKIERYHEERAQRYLYDDIWHEDVFSSYRPSELTGRDGSWKRW